MLRAGAAIVLAVVATLAAGCGGPSAEEQAIGVTSTRELDRAGATFFGAKVRLKPRCRAWTTSALTAYSATWTSSSPPRRTR